MVSLGYIVIIEIGLDESFLPIRLFSGSFGFADLMGFCRFEADPEDDPKNRSKVHKCITKKISLKSPYIYAGSRDKIQKPKDFQPDPLELAAESISVIKSYFVQKPKNTTHFQKSTSLFTE